ADLFYGRCPGGGDALEGLVDLYVRADRYEPVDRRRLLRALKRPLPPNAHYIDAPFEARTVRAKYALLTLAQFERLVQRRTLQSYFWARFAQPTRMVFAASPAVQQRVTRALATAVATTAGETVPLLDPEAVRNDLWARAF